MLLEARDNTLHLSLCEDLVFKLDLSTICISTFWLWIVVVGCRYGDNKQCYYTDCHEIPDVLADISDGFLVEYF